MPDRTSRIEETLLDLHLDRLDGDARTWIEEELRRDAALRTRNERVGRILQPLDSLRLSPAPVNLADKVLAFVKPTVAATRGAIFPMRTGGSVGRAPFVRMRELIAVAACLALLVGVGVPGVRGMRDRARRAMCADNLASIFQGTSAYQAAFDGSLPFAGGILGASWLPGTGGGPYASNSRHPYLLVKFKFVPKLADFACASRADAEAMPVNPPTDADDFPSARNVGYDSLSLGGASPNLRPPTSLAYMSDANPLFVGARFNGSVDPARTNSPAHRGRGQTVLTLDGQVRFVETPVYDRHGDNLWTISDVRQYRGTESPTRRDDAFLVPGFPASDPRLRNQH